MTATNMCSNFRGKWYSPPYCTQPDSSCIRMRIDQRVLDLQEYSCTDQVTTYNTGLCRTIPAQTK